MAPNIYCCGVGTAADTEAVTDMVSSQLQLHRYHTGRESRVVTALTLLKKHLFNYQGYVQAALVLGGVDCTGPHLHTIYPHGSTDTLPFATMGSGSLAAMAMFESKYKEGLTLAWGSTETMQRLNATVLATKRRAQARSYLSRYLLGSCITRKVTSLSRNFASETKPKPDVYSPNKKISHLIRTNRLSEARALFDKTVQRNTVTWNAMINGYVKFR
ncbi:hypothetical protein Patl1_35848 [Pistacia atlantica]|nr:hypothetical protein Patl1_35848 [Pistacia atlantica]